jgi:imidazolonepropionase
MTQQPAAREPDGATLFTSIGELFDGTTPDAAALHRGAALLVADGRVVAVGEEAQLRGIRPDAQTVDCGGGVITPGFVDSHSHAVFGRWRSWEYPLRARGTPYMEIARQGGGIHASVRDTRQRSESELVTLTVERLHDALRLGTTTIEIKSGYGLDLETELRQLRAVRQVAERVPLDVVPTFLGAHEVPMEMRDRPDAYVDLLVEEMIPAVAAERLAQFCDVFMEPGVFTGPQARRVLEAGLRHGLVPKLHADELQNSGGAELAAALGAASADHLGQGSDAGIAALAAGSTVATLLPATLFFLGKKQYAPARRLLDAGARVALATDFNPGSAPSPSMPLVLTIACSQMGMEPVEALHAATAGGARALRIEDGRGTLTPGAPADIVQWRCADANEVAYRFGAPPIAAVWKRGRRVV